VLVALMSWLPNDSGPVGNPLATGATPVPLSQNVCVLPAMPLLLSVTVSVPVREPLAVGVTTLELAL
jgi:hypothetical protein